MKTSTVILRPDPSRTVIRPFTPGDPAAFVGKGAPRVERVLERVLGLDDQAVRDELARMIDMLDNRHRGVDDLLIRRFEEVRENTSCPGSLSREQQLLVGAYFSEEYSFEAAALFNPSIVVHEDQDGVPAGCIRFAMSLRGIGEGHVSSVTFRTGIWGPGRDVEIDPPSDKAVAPRIVPLENSHNEDMFCLSCDESEQLSETVLFPVAPSQRQGIEDVRMVRFVEDDGAVTFYGTYTAFSGSATRSELLQARSFKEFLMRPMRGVIAETKGTALFPRKLDGRYAMLGRQDNESIWLMFSEHLTEWNEAAKLVSPCYPWEYVQMGNCGSPIEIDEGWLVLTHGVGVVRNYCIGACLLDKQDPSKVLARTPEPLLRPDAKDRDGYVPNVVYSCGGLVHERTLLLPYGVADNYAAFASAPVDEILAAMA